MIDENKLIEKIQQDSTEFKDYRDADIKEHFINLIKAELNTEDDTRDLINREALRRDIVASMYHRGHQILPSPINYLPVGAVWDSICNAPKPGPKNSSAGDSLISREALKENLCLYLKENCPGEGDLVNVEMSLNQITGVLDKEQVISRWGCNDR